MQSNAYPHVGETLFTETLPNGLRLCVLPKPGFRTSYAVFATNYGGAHRRFTLNGQTLDTRRAWPTIWSTKCSTCPAATTP